MDFYGYPWISMDIHALTCYGYSIQGYPYPTHSVKLHVYLPVVGLWVIQHGEA